MPVPVGDVRIMRMRVHHRLVLVGMRVRLARVDPRGVLMLVVLVVDMRMRVGERLVMMLVVVPLAQVQRHASHHQHAR